MDTLSVLLDSSIPYGEVLRRLAGEGWSAGGAGASVEQVARAHDAPAELRDWWLAPVGRGISYALDRGMPRILSPEEWVTSFPEDHIFAFTEEAIGYWSLDPAHRVHWIPAPETQPVAVTPLRSWLASFWIMEAIQSTTEHQSAVLDDGALREALVSLQPLPLEAWPWPAAPTRFYGAPDRFAIVFAAPEGGWAFWEGLRAYNG